MITVIMSSTISKENMQPTLPMNVQDIKNLSNFWDQPKDVVKFYTLFLSYISIFVFVPIMAPK